MKDKFSKVKSLIRKYGVIGTLNKVFKHLIAKIGPKINIVRLIKAKKGKRLYINEINEAIKKADRIVIWRSSFGWNVPLYQRPQQVANCLSKEKTVVLYEVTNETDKVSVAKKQQDNLFLINFTNPLIKKWITELLEKTNKPKYLQIYSTNWSMSVSEMKQYIKSGYKVIYEYIDDLSPVLAGTKELPVNIKEKYEYVMSHTDNIYVIVTAEEIMKDVVKKRGRNNLALACNGVDYNFFKNIDNSFEFDEDFKKVLEEKKPIIGYYGALASWFDYDLIKELARKRADYNIVFFGIKYDDSIEKAKLEQYENIHYLGARNYKVLKNYANKFTVCTIPFLINSITEATSPVKLFEYMALEKPIVTTDMKECRKYKSVLVAKNHEEYIEFIDKAIEMNRKQNENKKYFELLDKEARENDWMKKTEEIIKLISKDE